MNAYRGSNVTDGDQMFNPNEESEETEGLGLDAQYEYEQYEGQVSL